MSDTALPVIVRFDTTANRMAFTPSPGVPEQLYVWLDSDDQPNAYYWDGAAWQVFNGASGSGNVNAGGTLALNELVIGQGSTDVATTTTGTGILTALGINVGSAGAPVLFDGAGGTPSSLTLTNATGLVTAGINASQVTLAKIQNAGANSRWVGSGSAGSGAAYTENTFGSGLTVGASSVDLSTAAKTRAITFTIDGGGSVPSTGVKGDVSVPYACTITGVRMLADQSGSAVIDIWKDTYANYPPTVADTITASAKPTITTATKSEDTTLTGWTTSVSAGDTLRFNLDSITTITRVVLILTVTV